ncbi:MAG: hypothetical protein J7545_16185 [Roseofilum sp. SBFL]|uniref:tetratricopeptide repeat protein n=1 Tax=unclassified Roseofilum TaxID=2620099 RepID=UPI001B1E653B|nr:MULTISPECIES: tetratricopeptide repeat protein [unclassified Roseofilum]MBP0015540.1 hypothetical protein [Roseofilum sp. SID3]MBP0023817.1 hypothetical protein [Roseofilum sp. SID2]MBP0038172.1 hypothetical protein [Roseofilum sp. SID1]MBP0043486.1 hypothetical protein [Roseofilum sp. SBFL]
MEQIRLILAQIQRSHLLMAIATLFLLKSILNLWYTLPPETLSSFNANLSPLNFWRYLGLIPLGLMLSVLLGWRNTQLHQRLTWMLLILVFLYPYYTVTWSPRVFFLAKSLYQQREAITLHVEQNFPEVETQWKQNIEFGIYQPVTSIFESQITDRYVFQPSSWEWMVKSIFGYSDAFFNSIGRGWSFAILGLSFSLLAYYLNLGDQRLSAWIEDLRSLSPWFFLLVLFILGSTLTVNLVNHHLETEFAKGNYSQVIQQSQRLAQWYPLVEGDQSFLGRWAKAGWYSKQPNPALIAFTQGLERYRLDNYTQAISYFQQALRLNPHFYLAQGYLATTQLNQGIDQFKQPVVPKRQRDKPFPYTYDLLDSPNYQNRARQPNNAKPMLTAQYCEESLKSFPNHLEALYTLMVIRVVNRDFPGSAQIAKKLINLQPYFQQPMLAVVGQAYLHLSWENYHDQDLDQAWQRYRQSVDRKIWEKFIDPTS